jgi:hypothetical protein
MWNNESFYTSRISRNSVGPEMLIDGWDILYALFRSHLEWQICRIVVIVDQELSTECSLKSIVPGSSKVLIVPTKFTSDESIFHELYYV